MLEWNSVMRKIFHVYKSLSFLDKLNRIVFLINSVTLAAFISAWFSLREYRSNGMMRCTSFLYTMMMHATNISLLLYPWDRGSANHPIYNIQEGGEGGIMLSSWPTVWLTGSYSNCNRRTNVAGIVSYPCNRVWAV